MKTCFDGYMCVGMRNEEPNIMHRVTQQPAHLIVTRFRLLKFSSYLYLGAIIVILAIGVEHQSVDLRTSAAAFHLNLYISHHNCPPFPIVATTTTAQFTPFSVGRRMENWNSSFFSGAKCHSVVGCLWVDQRFNAFQMRKSLLLCFACIITLYF